MKGARGEETKTGRQRRGDESGLSTEEEVQLWV